MSPATDSAGIPFEGREFRPHPFAGDDGSLPSLLGHALTAFSQQRDEPGYTGVLDALRQVRVLVPLIAQAGEVGYTPEGRVVDKSQELSIVTLQGAEGESVGVMFSDTESMRIWRPDARPTPVEATRVAAWALAEGVPRVVLNPQSETEVVLRRSALAALVSGENFIPPWKDPAVVGVLSASLEATPAIEAEVTTGWEWGSPRGPDIVLTVSLPPGLDRAELTSLQNSLESTWAMDPHFYRVVDGIALRFVAATSPGQ